MLWVYHYTKRTQSQQILGVLFFHNQSKIGISFITLFFIYFKILEYTILLFS